eukprot:gnl/Trimastix_PCT/2008.p1 GENE.gnl/Trimastix_PCT/2008~~gnl/Trimastix_PCT/2008.p1  ORF type:complete len:117 (+),score=14.80 gnl/Trimastix_PCT/2008:44-352(+)
MAEVEETLLRISRHPGVLGILVANKEGKLLRYQANENSTLESNKERYAQLCSQLAQQARSLVRDLDPTNDLAFFRIRSRRQEIMIAPERDYTLLAIQDQESK